MNVSVPVEPTEKMLLHGARRAILSMGQSLTGAPDIKDIYKAMLAAAPPTLSEDRIREIAAIESALWELIKLKDIKEQMEAGTAGPFLHSHYGANKDAAWTRAREAAKNYTAALAIAPQERWIEEELKDGDRICEALGLQRTEGGRLPMYKILAAIGAVNAAK